MSQVAFRMNKDKDHQLSSRSGPVRSTSSVARSISIAAGKIDSRDLFVGTREVMINHHDDVYRLRVTSQNKLILTK